jgi:GR25 family glycosyltransferase involved in LPS biosynthesis
VFPPGCIDNDIESVICVEIFWINLDERTDRAEQCEIQLKGLELFGNRVPATNRNQIETIPNTDDQYYFKGVAACRDSHMHALSLFLKTDSDLALVLEDDFLFSDEVNRELLVSISDNLKKLEINFLQIGFLPFGNTLLKFVPHFFEGLLEYILARRIKLSKRSSDPEIVLNHLMYGSHAYILDREMARTLLQLAESDFKMPYDSWLIQLRSKGIFNNKNLKTGRLKRPVVAQNRHYKSDLQSWKS